MPVLALQPPEPAQGTVEEIRGSGVENAALSYQQYRIHVFGITALDRRTLQAAVRPAKTLSDAVRALTRAYADAGFLVPQLHYARDGDDVYVLVQPHAVTAVRAPPPLDAYFDGMQSAVTAGSFERRRTLATLHADRACLVVEPKPVAENGALVLDLKPDDGGPAATTASLEFGNPGNRFSGRHFLTAEVGHALGSGDRLELGWSTGLSGLNDESGADDYDEQKLAWSRVTPYGLFGLGGRNIDYAQILTVAGGILGQNPQDVRFEGRIRQAHVSWSYPLHAAGRSLWTGELRSDYTDKTFEDTRDGSETQAQEYTSAQLGLFYSRRLGPGGRDALEAGLSLRQGFGNDGREDALEAADLGYRLLRPEAHASWTPHPRWTLQFDAYLQHSGDVLPEQEQWVLGGVGNAEAWLPGVAVGDRGALARLELQHRPLAVGGMLFQPALFAEYGRAEWEAAAPGQDEDDGSRTLADAGLRLKAEFAAWLEASVSSAQPLHDGGIGDATLDDYEADWFFSVKAKF